MDNAVAMAPLSTRTGIYPAKVEVTAGLIVIGVFFIAQRAFKLLVAPITALAQVEYNTPYGVLLQVDDRSYLVLARTGMPVH